MSYKYGSNYVINGINLTIKEGKKVLIKGNSGCGKSTLAKIISGFLEIPRNKVYIGNTDLNDINKFQKIKYQYNPIFLMDFLIYF